MPCLLQCSDISPETKTAIFSSSSNHWQGRQQEKYCSQRVAFRENIFTQTVPCEKYRQTSQVEMNPLPKKRDEISHLVQSSKQKFILFENVTETTSYEDRISYSLSNIIFKLFEILAFILYIKKLRRKFRCFSSSNCGTRSKLMFFHHYLLAFCISNVSCFEKTFDRMGLGQEDSFQPSFQSNFRGEVENTYFKELEKEYRTNFEQVDRSDYNLKYGQITEDYSEASNYGKDYDKDYQSSYLNTYQQNNEVVVGHKENGGRSHVSDGRIHGTDTRSRESGGRVHVGSHKKHNGQTGNRAGSHHQENQYGDEADDALHVPSKKPVNGLEHSEYYLPNIIVLPFKFLALPSKSSLS